MAATAPLLSEEDRDKVIGLYTELKTKYTALDAAIAAGKPAGEIKTAIDKITADLDAIQKKHTETIAQAQQRLDAIEEKQRQAPSQPEPPKSIGQLVIEDAGLLAFIKQGGRGAHTVQLKTTIARAAALIGYKDIGGLTALLPQRLDLVGVAARLPIGVRALVPQGRTTAGAITYVEESAFTNNAAPVAEGGAKPKSDKTFTPRTLPVEVIAHYFKASRQTLDDLPFVASQIESNGIYGVQKAEDNQLLNGTGATPQLKGFNTTATVATGAPAGASLVDAIGVAVFELAAAGYMPDGTVVNPADWGTVALLKNSQGNYLFANPVDYNAVQRIWGTRLVQSTHQAAGTFLVGAFQGHSQILDREEVNVQIATQNEDDFTKNLVTILVEERLVLAIYVPQAFKKGVKPAPVI
jgi:HK97 family phage major capsid protein